MRISPIYFNLPSPLLLLVFSILAQSPSLSLAQPQPATLQLNRLATFSISSTQKSLSIPLPQTTQPVVLSVELCTQVDGQQPPRFFAGAVTGTPVSSTSSGTRSSASASITGLPTADDEQELVLATGSGIWQSGVSLNNGGVLKVQLDQATGTGTWSFSVGISTNENAPLHALSQSSPLYGDATSTSALLFSDPFSDTAIPFQEPSSPRYDLPPPIPSSPTAPDSVRSVNSTLIIVPTSFISSLQPANGAPSSLSKSACFLQALSSSQLAGATTTPSLVLRNQAEGWRTQFLVAGLQPSTGYTVYTLTTNQGGGRTLSEPSSFKTKAAAFPWSPATYDGTNFPPAIQQTLTQSLASFTASLKTFPCGREVYSIIQSCASCERAYRNWLCSVLIPRCGESDTQGSPPLVPPAALINRSITASNTTATSARLDQTVFSSAAPVTDYVELLPCLETCHAVDRACPPNIQWTCPRKGLGAERSYGVGFVDREGDEVSGGGVEGGGTTGSTQDRNGNVWCNGIV